MIAQFCIRLVLDPVDGCLYGVCKRGSWKILATTPDLIEARHLAGFRV